MNTRWQESVSRAITLGVLVLNLAACGSRVVIGTGTTLGLKATPGDLSTRPPQVTLGYKRAETAFIPTSGEVATKNQDAFSTLAALYFQTEWIGDTELRSFVGTGIAAVEVQGKACDSPGEAVQASPKAATSQSPFWDAFNKGKSAAGQ